MLRIRCDDAEAKINLGLKYGADLRDVPELLAMAKDLGLQVGPDYLLSVACVAGVVGLVDVGCWSGCMLHCQP